MYRTQSGLCLSSCFRYSPRRLFRACGTTTGHLLVRISSASTIASPRSRQNPTQVWAVVCGSSSSPYVIGSASAYAGAFGDRRSTLLTT